MRRDLISGARRRLARVRDQRAMARVLARRHLTEHILMTNAPPRLLDLQQASASVHTTAPSLVADLLGREGVEPLERLRSEFAAVSVEVDAREAVLQRSYPEYFTVEAQMSELLYLLVRLTRPEVVLETGVADGRSTAVTLAALAANGTGTLHSVDISPEVGGLVTDRERWRLHVVDPLADDFERVVAGLPSIDLFLHDGDHSYAAQTREYEAVWPRMHEGGVFLSDDVDYSWAFVHFLDRKGLRPHLLMEQRKAVGAVRR
jgi:predicted O-methyltransferase YrrM